MKSFKQEIDGDTSEVLLELAVFLLDCRKTFLLMSAKNMPSLTTHEKRPHLGY